MSRIVGYLVMLRDIVLFPLIACMPRNRKKIIFGAWGGKAFSCNSKYLYLYMIQRGGYECIWFGNKEIEAVIRSIPGARFVRKGSLLAFWHYITAGIYAFNVDRRWDIMNLPVCRRAKQLYLTHGAPDKKLDEFQLNGKGSVRWKHDDVQKTTIRMRIRKLIDKVNFYFYSPEAWCSASSLQGIDIFVINLPKQLSRQRMLHSGTPRADYIIRSAHDAVERERVRDKYAKLLNINKDKRWYLFVPTWRHDPKYLFSFTASSRACEYKKFFTAANAVLIDKQHPLILKRGIVKGGVDGPLVTVDAEQAKKIETEELLVAADVLITDYSSIYYDFYLMDRPVIHFTYDFDHAYNMDFGFCFDIREYGGGPFAYTEDELLKYLNMTDDQLLALRNKQTKDQLAFETGHACEAYYDLICQLAKEKKRNNA